MYPDVTDYTEKSFPLAAPLPWAVRARFQPRKMHTNYSATVHQTNVADLIVTGEWNSLNRLKDVQK